VELKHGSEAVTDSGEGSVTFNRTSVELKPVMASATRFLALSFNRTSVELKHFSYSPQATRFETFNRTSVELKHVTGSTEPQILPCL